MRLGRSGGLVADREKEFPVPFWAKNGAWSHVQYLEPNRFNKGINFINRLLVMLRSQDYSAFWDEITR